MTRAEAIRLILAGVATRLDPERHPPPALPAEKASTGSITTRLEIEEIGA